MIESRERALFTDPGLRKGFETSVGVTSTHLNIRRPKPTWGPSAESIIGSLTSQLQQIAVGDTDSVVCLLIAATNVTTPLFSAHSIRFQRLGSTLFAA